MNISINQLAGLIIILFSILIGFIKWYLDAKLDPIGKQVDRVMNLVIQHHEDIGTLKGKIK